MLVCRLRGRRLIARPRELAFLDAARTLGLYVPTMSQRTPARPRLWNQDKARRRRLDLLDLDDFLAAAKTAYRRLAMNGAHPDHGGTPAAFRALTEAMRSIEATIKRERRRRGDEPWPAMIQMPAMRRTRRANQPVLTRRLRRTASSPTTVLGLPMGRQGETGC